MASSIPPLQLRAVPGTLPARAPTGRVPSQSQPDADLRPLEGSRAPLRWVAAGLATRFVARKGWERLGFARAGDYARECLGVSGRQLHELARTGGALAGLPRVEAAFVSGALSWSKARLVCGVATPGDEAAWVAFARRVPVARLAREVRAVDRGAVESGGTSQHEEAEAERSVGVKVRCSAAARAKFQHVRQVAQWVSGERLSVAECVEVVTAEVLSALPMEVDGYPVEERASSADRAGRTTSDPTHNAGVGCAALAEEDEPEPWQLPPFLESLVEGIEDADAFELHARLRRALLLEQRVDAEMAPLLARVARGRLYRAAGHRSLEAYVREALGMSPRKAWALLRLERACSAAPALREAWRGGQLSWVQAHALVPIVLAEGAERWHAEWIERAVRVSVRRLEEEVEAAVALCDVDPAAFEATGGLQMCAPGTAAGGVHDRLQTCARATGPAETARFFFTAPSDVARIIRAVLCSVRRHLERAGGRPATEGEAAEWMFDHVLEAWGANERVRREHRVFERDGWRCTVPGCSSFRNLHAHHIVFRSAGGGDEASNLTSLCAWHHQRGVHAGRVRCRGLAPAGLRFELGVRDEHDERDGGGALFRFGPGEQRQHG